MLRRNSLIFRFHRQSRYSVAALLGAIETDSRLKDWDLYAPEEVSPSFVADCIEQGETVIAHSVMSTQVDRVREEVAESKKTFGDKVTIIGGGAHASARPQDLLDSGFDYVVVGEGERALPQLLYDISTHQDPTSAEGVVGPESDSYPIPRVLDRVDLNEYPPFALNMNVVGPIEVTRGCPFGCKFCATPFLSGGVVRHRSVEMVKYWLTRAVDESGFRRAWLLSPNALCYGGRGRRVERDALESLLSECSSIEGLDGLFFGSFPSEVRPEFVDRAVLDMMRRYVTNETLQIGLQSGSDRVLRVSNRRHTVQQGIDAARTALDCGFRPHVDIIFGLPGEKREDLDLSLQVCEELVDMGALLHGHVFMPLPGSAVGNEAPGTLDPDTRGALGELSRKGLMTGSWCRQEKLGKELAD
ncbi:TIGR04013 family B12-binding domain/radical SAM domain-containing protein [Candidatus Thorarchaeota archaeon]|nr:MAG: TIGR04013 family B12-binding domain/radical SAM domain-containing protein [Candidatus Thorarchaeota archaeon]